MKKTQVVLRDVETGEEFEHVLSEQKIGPDNIRYSIQVNHRTTVRARSIPDLRDHLFRTFSMVLVREESV